MSYRCDRQLALRRFVTVLSLALCEILQLLRLNWAPFRTKSLHLANDLKVDILARNLVDQQDRFRKNFDYFASSCQAKPTAVSDLFPGLRLGDRPFALFIGAGRPLHGFLGALAIDLGEKDPANLCVRRIGLA